MIACIRSKLPSYLPAGTLTLDGAAVTCQPGDCRCRYPEPGLYSNEPIETGTGYATLQYTVCDGEDESTPATLTFNVTAENDAPTASDNTRVDG